MKFHWTTAVTQFLSDSLPPTAPTVLLALSPPPATTPITEVWGQNQGLQGMVPSPQSSLVSFHRLHLPLCPQPSWEPPGLRVWLPHLLCCRRIQGPLLISASPDPLLAGSRVTQSSAIYCALLCARHCVRHIPPGVHRPRRVGGENTDSCKAVCVHVRKTPGPRRTLRGHSAPPSTPWTHIWSKPKCWKSLLGAQSSVLISEICYLTGIISTYSL